MTRGIVILLFDIAALVGLSVLPLYRKGEEDHGDGLASVRLPPPRKTKGARVLVFYALALLAATVVVACRGRFAIWYGGAVSGLVDLVTGKPNLSHAVHESVLALVPVLAAFDVLAFAVMVRASALRRLLIALHSVLLLALSINVDAVLLVVWHATGAQVGPRTLTGLGAHIMIGTLVIVRMIFATFQLPKPTALPLLRKKWSADGFLAFMCVVSAGALVVGSGSLLHLLAPHRLAILGAYVAYPLFWMFLFVLLFVLASRRRPPSSPAGRVPIDVIIPAYNEIAGLHLTLRSIDAAASRYGGPVRVIVADDGSDDGTGDLARAEIAAFGAATGVVVEGGHLGKAAALNTALAHADAEVVVRVDADVVIDPHAFDTLPEWFSDPSVGSVGAMTYPRQDSLSWFHRMRLFECMMSFGFTRQSQTRVDALPCIPGTYTAFRRPPVVHFGGFVSVMNGEDMDLTMQLARLGYRIELDPRIVIFEDVPPTLAEFREQRVRWNRAGMHNAARHSPFTAGFAGPRLWLSFTRQLTMRLTAIARPCVFAFLVALSALAPASRSLATTLLGLYLVSSAPFLFVCAALAVRHKFARRIPWLLTWWVFTMVRRAFVVDSLFTLPVKPVYVPAFVRDRPASARPSRLPEPAGAPSAAR